MKKVLIFLIIILSASVLFCQVEEEFINNTAQHFLIASDVSAQEKEELASMYASWKTSDNNETIVNFLHNLIFKHNRTATITWITKRNGTQCNGANIKYRFKYKSNVFTSNSTVSTETIPWCLCYVWSVRQDRTSDINLYKIIQDRHIEINENLVSEDCPNSR